MVRRKTSKIANEYLSIIGQHNNPQSDFHKKHQSNKDQVIKDLISKYKLKERRVIFLKQAIEKKSTK